ncbi:MAG: WXG100 family type VII secretion target [Microbacteriaceae bacterium]|jgi:early secretory antigenic target protein ESAT-6|nr:WXG100 family type VII secretion target [Microbacteriaceae bacterium]
MTRYTVDSDAVLSAASHARATIARLQSEVQTLNSQLHALGGSWSGPAATAFLGVHESWRATQSAVEANLQALTQALAAAGTHYRDMEIANARLFQR